MGKPKALPSPDPAYDGKPRMIYRNNGFEVWARWANEPALFELFLSEECDDYIGCADSYNQACIVARECVEEIA